MRVVWENLSDCITISVQKVSGSTTSMVSPSFFRSSLVARKEERIQDISAIFFEHSSLACYILEEIEWTGVVEVGRPLVCCWLG
jgi:hypothetical protein